MLVLRRAAAFFGLAGIGLAAAVGREHAHELRPGHLAVGIGVDLRPEGRALLVRARVRVRVRLRVRVRVRVRVGVGLGLGLGQG